MAHNQQPTVLVPIAHGSEEIEAVTIVDTLVRAGALVTVASVSKDLHVTCSRGVKLIADTFIGECLSDRWDMIALPGGLPGAEHLRDCPYLKQLLQHQNSKGGGYIAAICASPALVLAHHGILNDKLATAYPSPSFTSKLPNYSTDRVVVDGNIITSKGPGTALQFSIKLVELLKGGTHANTLAKDMIL